MASNKGCMLTVSLLINNHAMLYIKCFSSPAGAMRLPCTPDDPNKTHFLTDYYGEKFKLKMVPFVNSNEKAFLKFYNMPRIQQEGTWNKR